MEGVTEKGFQQAVIDLAHLHGWRVAHFRPAMTKRGSWVTAVQGDGAGFPDLILVRERVIFAELKVKTGKLKPAQAQWIVQLQQAGAEVYMWRPENWKEIEATLKRKERRQYEPCILKVFRQVVRREA